MPTATKPKESLTILMRRLRPFLSGEVKKLGDHKTGYVVNGKVQLTFNYYCSWSERKNEEKKCFPVSITISAYRGDDGALNKAGHHKYHSFKVFRTRTIPKRKDGTFALESIAAIVTKGSLVIDEYVKQLELRKIEQDKKEKEFNRLIKLLVDSLPKGFVRSGRGSWVENGNDSIQIQIENVADEGPPQYAYNLTLNVLTLDEVVAMTEHLLEMREL